MGKKLYLCKLKKCPLMNNKTIGEYRFAIEYYGEFATIRNLAGLNRFKITIIQHDSQREA